MVIVYLQQFEKLLQLLKVKCVVSIETLVERIMGPILKVLTI